MHIVDLITKVKKGNEHRLRSLSSVIMFPVSCGTKKQNKKRNQYQRKILQFD